MSNNHIDNNDNLKKLFDCLNKIDIHPKNKILYKYAITHPSYNSNENYKRLAFCGDGIIRLVVTDFIYKEKNNTSVKKMSNKRDALIRNNLFTQIIKQDIKLEEVLLIDLKIKQKLSAKSKVWANMFEAIVGAIYDDLGIEKTKDFINECILSKTNQHTNSTNTTKVIDDIKNDNNKNYGNKLFNLHIKGIKYENSKIGNKYRTRIFIKNKLITEVLDNSKKAAKELAAKQVYEYYKANEK